jgi:hypothetical protein
MDTKDTRWLAEIDRRAALYDSLEGREDGRLGVEDYLGMIALCLGLTVIFWAWAV